MLTGGLLTINGNAPANNVTLSGGTLQLQSPKADSTNTSGAPTASGTLTYASGQSSTLQIQVAQTGTNGATFSQTIGGYAAGDVIDLQFLTKTGATLAQTQNGTSTNVTVTGGGSSGSETFTFANTTAGGFSLAPESGTGTGTELVYAAPVCFTTGTRIATARGEVPVEALVVGDLAVTASGATRPIRWIGHRVIEGAAMTADLHPVQIRAGAFGLGLPARDLRLSPGHPVLVLEGADADGEGGSLVPIMCLVNGTIGVPRRRRDRSPIGTSSSTTTTSFSPRGFPPKAISTGATVPFSRRTRTTRWRTPTSSFPASPVAAVRWRSPGPSSSWNGGGSTLCLPHRS